MQKLKFLTILAALIAFAACDEINNLDVGPEIKIPEVSKEIFASGVKFEAAVSGQGLNKTVQFTATDAWSVDVTDTKASSWVTVVPTSGTAGDITLSVTAEPNPEFSERAAIVTIKCGPISTSFTVRQAAKAAIPVSEVKLDKPELSLLTGESAKLVATVNPSDATDKTVKWVSSDESVATVKDGTVTAVAAGFATIAVQAGDKTATCAVTVTDPVVEVASISLTPDKLDLLTGDSETLVATVLPDNATVKTITWTSSDSKVAYVSAGEVRAISAGTATITAQAGDKTATCEVTVTDPVIAVESISLDQPQLEMQTGEKVTLTATVNPSNASNKTISWTSSDEAVATVKNGIVTATGAGKAVITAQAGEQTATCEVVVTDPVIEVTSVTLNNTKLEVYVGMEGSLTATVNPSNATDQTVTWSTSNKAVATVKDGVVKGVSIGTAIITAKAGDQTATCEVNVVAPEVPVASVNLNKTTLGLLVGQSETLVATVLPSDASAYTISWTSSKPSVATVSGSSGVVTAVAPGSAVITVNAGGQTATCNVTVTTATIAVESISVSPASASLSIGGTQQLTASFTPADATNQGLTWESADPNIASVSSTGLVTAVAAGGPIVIKAISNENGSIYGSCSITVTAPVPVSSVTINKDTLRLEIDGTETLTASVLPLDAADPSVSWTSTAIAVATVSDAGLVTALTAGQSYVIAQAGEQKDTCVVVVSAPSLVPTSITLDKPTLGLTVGGYYTLTATVGPDSATDKSVSWESLSPSIASVTNAGKVTGVAVGSAIIKATTVNGLEATCTVTVISASVDPGSPDPFNAEENW